MTAFSKLFVVSGEQTARAVGSGDLEVLATPALAAMIENTAKEYLKNQLKPATTSVGIYLELSHLKPSYVGASIDVRLQEVTEHGTKVTYQFEVYDGLKKIAVGQHQRAIVEIEPFLQKLLENHNN